MPSRYTQRILDHLSNKRYQPTDAREIARQMGVGSDQEEVFSNELGRLLEENKVVLGVNDVVQLPTFPDEFEGKIKITSKGFGFVTPDSPSREGDLFIPAKATSDAVSGDRVRVAVQGRGSSGGRGAGGGQSRGPAGRVLEILERNKTRFTGTTAKQRGSWFVIPDGKEIREPILVRDAGAKSVKEGDKVIIDIVHYPSADQVAEGVIAQVLGDAGKPDVETAAVIANFGLSSDFSDEVIEEARQAAAAFDKASAEGPWSDRLDLTDLVTFTIDPYDARDFDDAISLEYDEENKQYELGVHIADVAHFVVSGGELDKEGYNRGNSTYLPRLVIPMLPELLSNGVCSLQEGVNRFVKSVFVLYDQSGRVIGHRYHRAVIRSHKRLTYLEAQALIDGDQEEAAKHAQADPKYTDVLVDALRRCEKLAQLIRKRRFEAGMLSLSLPESELVFDENGHVKDAVPEDDAFTHTLIEMFMVAGNEAVASLFASLNVPLLRRIHPEPDYNDLEELRDYARLVRFKLPQEPKRADLQALIKVSTGTPYERAIHFAVLKTLTRACYSPALVGHFALASDHYAHYTSPIRRYPDLTVHRALEAYLDATENGTSVPGGKGRGKLADMMEHDEQCLDEGKLGEIGRHCSATEVNSDQAEKSLRTFLVLQFLKEQDPGETYEGTVTGTTAGGALFVTIDKYLVDGMVRPQDLPGGDASGTRWHQNKLSGRLVAEKSGMSIGVGDQVTVQVGLIDLAAREMNLSITSFKPVEPPIGGTEVRAQGARHDSGRGGSRRRDKSGKRKGYKMGRRGKRSL